MKTIIIEDLEVRPAISTELVGSSWHKASDLAKELGNGWRLPTIKEFREILYPNRNRIPNLRDVPYWSSTMYDGEDDYAWYFYFQVGKNSHYNRMRAEYYTLAVRDFTVEIIVADLLKEF